MEPNATKIFSVTALLSALNRRLKGEFGRVIVEGEISNYKQHSSGHCYFSLGDPDSQLRCVMWRSTRQRVRFAPEDGMAVRVRGEVAVYAARGDLQLVVQAMQPAGEGDFQKAFLALKRKLEKEGLFDTELKKPLPKFPTCLGVITSESGAALHDILSILERRYPLVRVLVLPVQVQGTDAGRQIAAAIDLFNADRGPLHPDVLIIGRGGGSVEDLWAFNEERVARAIYASVIPIISAVGHETDFSISDFVADVRAATPSMAAELAVPDGDELMNGLAYMQGHIETLIGNRITGYRDRVNTLSRSHALRRLTQRIETDAIRVRNLRTKGQKAIVNRQTLLRERALGLSRILASLDPDKPFKRGFVRVKRDGSTITSGLALKKGDDVALQFADAERTALISD